jgi:hypothetical protein
MSSQIYRRILVIAAAATLAACASTAPKPDTTTAQANLAKASNQAAVSEASSPLGTSGPALKPGNGYRKITKNGETYYCQKEVLTGSRTNAKVSCLTQDEMTALSQNGQDLLNGIRSVPGSQGTVDGSGGQYNTAVSGQ